MVRRSSPGVGRPTKYQPLKIWSLREVPGTSGPRGPRDLATSGLRAPRDLGTSGRLAVHREPDGGRKGLGFRDGDRGKGTGVLPNVKWTKDRGKDTADAPWYHLGPEYDGKEGDRVNDHHLSLETKRRARRERGD